MNSKNNEVLMVLELTEKTNCRGIAYDYFLWVMFFNGKKHALAGYRWLTCNGCAMYFVVAFRAQAYAAYSKKLLNPVKITSSARLTTAEILNDQKQTLSDLKIDLLSAPYCIIQSHLTMNSSRR